MKKTLCLLLVITLLSTFFVMPAYAADTTHPITMEELNDLLNKYNIKADTNIDRSTITKDSVKSLTKEELESYIIKGLQLEKEGPRTINVTDEINTNQLLTNTFNASVIESLSTSPSYGTVIKNEVKSLSKTVQVINSDFYINGTVAATYQYTAVTEPGNSYSKDWKFTGVSDGSSVQVNSPLTGYSLKQVISSDATYTSTAVTKTARYKYDYGFFVDINGQIKGVPISTGLEVTVNYYWYLSDVQ